MRICLVSVWKDLGQLILNCSASDKTGLSTFQYSFAFARRFIFSALRVYYLASLALISLGMIIDW